MQRAKDRQQIQESVSKLHSYTTSGSTLFSKKCISSLTKKYIHGFDGQINFILSTHSAPFDLLGGYSNNTSVTCNRIIVGEATNLKRFLKHYRTEYGDKLKPMHFSPFRPFQLIPTNLRETRCDRFVLLHMRCMQLMSKLEAIIPDLDGKYYHVLEGEIGIFKFMTEQIGADINYPGLKDLGLNVNQCLNTSLRSVKMWDQQQFQLKADHTMAAMIAIREAIPSVQRFCHDVSEFLRDVSDFIELF